MTNKKASLGNFGKGYFRVIEILAILIFIACFSGLAYLAGNVLKKESGNVGELQKQTVELRDQIKAAKKTIEEYKAPDNNTKDIVESLESFQTRFLKNQQEGRIYVVNQINKLVKNNGVSLTGGISFDKTDPDADDKENKQKNLDRTQNANKPKSRRSETTKKPLYPSLDVTFVVAGNYSSFRKFLYALETDKMFFVIENLSLQTADNEAKTSTVGSQRVASVQRTLQQNPGEVTVQIGVKAYFRKEDNVTN